MNAGNEDVSVGSVPERWLGDVLPRITAANLPPIVLLPQYVEDGIAVFPAELMHSVKLLRANGIESSFVTGDHGKSFQSEYSAAEVVFVALLINVASSAVWDGLKLLFGALRKRLPEVEPNTPRQIAVVRLGVSTNPDGSRMYWQEISGPPGPALDRAESMFAKFLESSTSSSNDGSGDHVDSVEPFDDQQP